MNFKCISKFNVAHKMQISYHENYRNLLIRFVQFINNVNCIKIINYVMRTMDNKLSVCSTAGNRGQSNYIV